jgi:hypothetical protein
VQVLDTSHRVLRFQARVSESRASAAESVELTAVCLPSCLAMLAVSIQRHVLRDGSLFALDRAGTR